MARPKPEETKPFDYIREVKAAQKHEKPSLSNLGTALRSDMVPASNVQPARESILPRDKLRAAVGILLGIVIVVFILFIVIGPGRPILEHNLAILAHQTTPTHTSTPTFSPPTTIPSRPTKTYDPSPTIYSTKTQVVKIITSHTPIPPSPTAFLPSPTRISPTLSSTEPGCRDVLSITLEDVGQKLCVKGTVIETITNPMDFMVIFSNKPGAFYWVTYDLVWSKGELDTCYQITGKIDRIGNSPILIFDYSNLPEVCP